MKAQAKAHRQKRTGKSFDVLCRLHCSCCLMTESLGYMTFGTVHVHTDAGCRIRFLLMRHVHFLFKVKAVKRKHLCCVNILLHWWVTSNESNFFFFLTAHLMPHSYLRTSFSHLLYIQVSRLIAPIHTS